MSGFAIIQDAGLLRDHLLIGGEWIVGDDGERSTYGEVLREPVGVYAAITPWKFSLPE